MILQYTPLAQGCELFGYLPILVGFNLMSRGENAPVGAPE
jgi:hypothetical protein